MTVINHFITLVNCGRSQERHLGWQQARLSNQFLKQVTCLHYSDSKLFPYNIMFLGKDLKTDQQAQLTYRHVLFGCFAI